MSKYDNTSGLEFSTIAIGVASGGFALFMGAGTIMEFAQSSGYYPSDSAYTLATTGAAGAFASTYISEGSGGDGFEIWKDSAGKWHIGDVVPYSAVEARATHIYNQLHSDQDAISMSFPAFVAESEEAAKAINEVFGCANSDAVSSKLSVFENLLTAIESDNTVQ